MFRRICLVAWVLFSVGVCQADPQPIGAFIGTTELLEVNIQRSAKIDNNALVYDAATGKLILEAQTATAGAHAPTHQPNGSDTLSDTYTVTNRQVIAGTGMSGGGDLSADRTLTLADTAVTPGTYGGATVSAQIVIDQQGRATSASDVTITGVTPAAHQASHQSTGSDPLNATYTVTTRQVIAGTGMTGGGDLSADRTLTLADTAVTPGTYGGATVSAQIVIDQQGRATSASDVTITGVTPAAHQASHQSTGSDPLNATYTVTTRQVIAGTGMTGGGDLSADRTLTLADTAVTPGTYGGATVSAQIVIDQQGRATSATDVTITGTTPGAHASSHQPNGSDTLSDTYTVTNRQVIAGTGMTGGGDLSADRTLTMADTAVTPGSYTSTDITVDQQGRITAASSGTAAAFTGDLDSATNKYLDNSGSSYGGAVAIRDSAGLVVSNGPETQSLTITADPLGAITLNASSGYFDIQDALGITGNTSVTGTLTVRDATNGSGLVVDRAGVNDVVAITAGTLASGKTALTLTGTMNAAAATQDGVVVTITGAGTDANQHTGVHVTLAAGFTGAGRSAAVRGSNSSAGTGTGLWAVGSYDTGVFGQASGVSAGHHSGASYDVAGSSSLNVGSFATAGFYGVGGTNAIGVVGHADASEAGAATGGFFTIQDSNTPTAPTLPTECALMADNRDAARDIFVARDNGTEVLVVEDGGVLRVSPGGTDNLIVDTSNVSITQPIEYGGSETAGSVVLVAGTATVTHNLGMDSPTTSYLVYATPQADPGAVFNVVQRYNDFDIVATNDVRVNWMIIIN